MQSLVKLVGADLRSWRIAHMGAVALISLSAVCPSAAQFSISPFKPWPGYAMSAGPMLVGDFAGDGKSDVLQLIHGSDYVHVWISQGGSTFDVKKFSPWPNYLISNGLFLVGDFDGDKKSDVVNAVANTDYAHVWTSNGDGTFAIKTFMPWPGYSMNTGRILVGDFDGDGKSDVFHAVGGADVHIWTAQAGAVPFQVKTFSPWPGYDMSGGAIVIADLNGDGKSDVFHAVTEGANSLLSRGDGTFDVKPFLPWDGYAMDDGFWLLGDFNGDGKADLMHVLYSGPSGFNVWLSNGDGTFNVVPFQPWPGYLTPNGNWQVGDFNHDGNADIAHLVASEGRANIWMSNGDGTFRVATFTPWPNYAMPNGQWLIGDFDGDGKSDLLHGVNSVDFANVWTSTLPGPGQVSIDGIEVVQAIQNLANDVSIVADKQTIVRVYLSSAHAAVLNVKGVLSVQAQSSTASVPSTDSLTLNWGPNPSTQSKREVLDRSLNFVLPPAQTSVGVRTFAVTIYLVSDGTPSPCSNCGTKSVKLNFETSAPLRVRIVGLRYRVLGTATRTFEPRAADFSLLQSWLKRAYPVPQVMASTTIADATAAWQFDCNAANAQLQAMRASELGSGSVDARTHYLGLVPNGGGFMRGCSSGIPANADPTVVASGPSGPPTGANVPINATGDTDLSFADWYGGHELAHAFGRSHPGFCTGNSSDDPSFPYPNGQLSNNAGTFVGLDVGDTNANPAIPRTVLPGQSRFDIMTYCNQPQWLSAYTYRAVRDRLTVENPTLDGAPGGGAPGSAGPGGRRGGAAAGPPRAMDRGVATKPSRPRPPRLVLALSRPASVTIGHKWSVPTTVVGADKPLRAQPATAAPLEHGPPSSGPPAADAPAPSELEGAPQGKAQVQLQRGRFVVIVATLNLTQGTGKILHVKHVPQAMVPTISPSTIASVRLLDRSGRVLGDYPQWVRHATDIPREEDQTALINATIPETRNVGLVELVLAERVVDRLEVPRTPPTLGTVRIRVADQPARGAFSIAWEAAPDSRNSYEVQISTDGGRTWETIAIGLRESTLVIAPSQLLGRKLTDVRVIASDGYNEFETRRREGAVAAGCLNHVIIFDECRLRGVLSSYFQRRRGL